MYLQMRHIILLCAFVPILGCSKDDPTGPKVESTSNVVTIDSKTESFMVDQFAGSKRISLVVNRAYRFSLNSDATPIHDRVCVMYQSTAGLTAATLVEGAPIQFTAGYSQAYVWLPDWSTIDDNTGTATVTITDLSNSTVSTVTINSKNESILLDGKPEAKFQPLKQGARVTASLSSTATPIPDRVFILYQSADRGLTIDALLKGAPLTFTSQYSQCAFFMPDWSTRGDNTGSAIITVQSD